MNTIIEQAQERAAQRRQNYVPVDYAALNKMVKRQRSALTRAVNSGNPDKVVLAAKAAVDEWNKPNSMWPDDWSRWQRALDDALGHWNAIQLEDL